MFEWGPNNLRKIRAHRITPEEAEEALLNAPVPIYEHDIGGEPRYVYYCETNSGRLLAVIVTERGDQLRVVNSVRPRCRPKARLSSQENERRVNIVNKKKVEIPKFKNEGQEADWWASKPGRNYVKQKSASTKSKGIVIKGSRLVAKLNKKSSVQIAIRLPEQDVEHARQIAERKGIGYQTLLRMLVHEGLSREGRRS